MVKKKSLWEREYIVLPMILTIGVLIAIILYIFQYADFYSLKYDSILKLEVDIDKTFKEDSIYELERYTDQLKNKVKSLGDKKLESSMNKDIAGLEIQINILSGKILSSKDNLQLRKDTIALKKEWIKMRSDFFGGLLQTGTLFFFLATVYLTLRNLKVAQENLGLLEEKQVTERFSKAVELLGHNDPEVRLGGIYALERIAKDSDADYWTVMEVLTGFVRENLRRRGAELEQDYRKFSLSFPPTDIQAVLMVLNRRDTYAQDKTGSLDLSNSDFRWMVLDGVKFNKMNLHKANLSNTDLSGTELTEAILTEAKFNDAKFVGRHPTTGQPRSVVLTATNLMNADFSGSDFRGANLKFAKINPSTERPVEIEIYQEKKEKEIITANLRFTKFSEVDPCTKEIKKADLSKANLRFGDFSYANFVGVNLEGANLLGANLTGANLAGANLAGAKLEEAILIFATFAEINPETDQIVRKADLSEAYLKGADLSQANLMGSVLNGADFTEAIIARTNLRKANLVEANLTRIKIQKESYPEKKLKELKGRILRTFMITGADLTGANLTGARFTEADLTGADLTGAVLARADLTGANLTGARLTGADLTGADLTGADLTGADLTGADLTGVIGISTD